ncbi:MAG: MBL fold metallo-hydrolase [Anaerolineae bacterium]|jgi:glyoxylase-like metal-dependent hydrolase (beta-lactamase superfamily II)|nr:MBL fold metallo-hydrolase [Anaerolineae bacterium]
MLQELIANTLYSFQDTCVVYILRDGAEATLIDFGSGEVLEALPTLGITHVTDVLLTHHHRDQAQGLPRAIAAGTRIWAPHAEQDLFHSVDAHWQGRPIFNNYNTREDRFSLLEAVPLTGTLEDYANFRFAGHEITVLPTPGHTTGSITLLTTCGTERVAFTGDLIAAPGKVWSLAATQWTYNGAEGAAATIASLLDLQTHRPTLLCPSHGAPIPDPDTAIALLVERLWRLLQARDQNPRLFQLRERPYEAITPHLLRHRASMANTYVLLSQSGKALLIDFGYDFITGIAAGADRASRRPWLYTLPALKAQFGVTQVEIVLPTHYHDDHVAGCNLLRAVEGTAVWAAENFADILERPSDFDLPCLWYDPIPVDRRLPLETPIVWEGITLTLHALPGHTRYAVAVAFEVDGVRVLATGDELQGDAGLEWNYVYQNRFAPGDYREAAALYKRLAPQLILSGHWAPQWVEPDYFDRLEKRGALLEQLHHELLPLEQNDFGDSGFLARIKPYQAEIVVGVESHFTVEIRNPLTEAATVTVEPVIPVGWHITEAPASFTLAARSNSETRFAIVAPASAHRARIAVDITVVGGPTQGKQRFGQQAEALVTVSEDSNRQ